MKKQILLGIISICGLANFTNGQVCLKPSALTTEQVQKVTGKWKGTYTNNGSEVEFVVDITPKEKNEVVCEINNPPLQGKVTAYEYFFCPSGEFHLRKYIGDDSFVFQGVPGNNIIKGTVAIYDEKNKRKMEGQFTMSKAE